MAADIPTADKPGWLRRHRVPLAAVAAVLLVRAVIFAMERFEVGLEHHFNAVLGYQFLCLLAVVVLAGWFLFFSGYSLRTRAAVSFVVIAAVGTVVAITRRVEFDGEMNPRFYFRWEPTGDELLARHLAQSGPATGGADLAVGPTDSPQFRGPRGDGVAPGVKLAEDWSAPPREVWRHPVGGGHAGVAVAGNSAVTLEQRGDTEAVICYDRATGKERWSFAYPARFAQSEPMGGDGPRTTPTVAEDGSVYTFGATG